MPHRLLPAWLLLAVAFALYATAQLGNLAYPLLWQDEGETAMYARRVSEHGYPVVHGERNVVYEFGTNVAQGVKEGIDAYIGTTWGHFYFAVPGLLWAERTDDDYARTWRLRLPFALAGIAGLTLLLLAVIPVYRDRPRRALVFAALFFLLAATSISLQLHLREVRYYPLLVLAVGAILWLQLRHVVFRQGSRGRYAVGLALLLVLLFNVFYAAWFAVSALLGLERAVAAWSGREAARREALLDLLPIAASALCVAPLLAFYETFQIASSLSRELGLTLGGYAANLGRVVRHFLRHELLAPMLATRALVLWSDARLPADPGPERGVADRLSLFALGYAALIGLNPLAYERYFVVLGPLVTLVFLLDAFRLSEQLPELARPAWRGALRRATPIALAALAGTSLAVRLPELRGRLAELSTPVRGPLDFVVEDLRARHPRVRELVVATNYENHPLMYYLGSRVVVGTNLSNIRRDRLLEPDVVIPRRRWRPGLAELQRFLERGSFEHRSLPVTDTRWNNIPALSRSPWVPEPHRFRTPEPADPSERLEIYERRAGGG